MKGNKMDAIDAALQWVHFAMLAMPDDGVVFNDLNGRKRYVHYRNHNEVLAVKIEKKIIEGIYPEDSLVIPMTDWVLLYQDRITGEKIDVASQRAEVARQVKLAAKRRQAKMLARRHG